MTAHESNRETVLRFCECLSRRHFAGMAELITSDATWWVVGRPDYFPSGGLHDITDILNVIDSFIGSFDEFNLVVDSSIVEGDRVAIEAHSVGRLGAARYKNVYLMRYQLHEGKIQSVREFFDAYEITDFLAQLDVASSDTQAHAHHEASARK